MKISSTKRLLCAAVLGVMTSASFSTAGSAAPVAQPALPSVENMLQQIQHRSDRADRRHDLRYDRRHHGERHRHRRPGYTHFHQGYYYATPWWAAVPVVRMPRHEPARIHRTNQRHVRWCLNQYRSYNPNSNLFVARDGRRYQCRSPYM